MQNAAMTACSSQAGAQQRFALIELYSLYVGPFPCG